MSALSTSLTALAADVAAVQDAIASAATASAVAALQTELDALEADLDDLLVSNNVYSTAITVNSAASMASALALGNKVALMNAAVTITDDATVSDTDIQTFIDRIKTMNGAVTYDSGSATGYAATIDELTAATSLDITNAGDISFKKLASATVVTITTSYSTKITSVDMGAMTSVTSIASGANGTETVNNLTVSSATNVDLGALTRYGAALTISTKKGATLDIASLDDTTSTGLQSDLNLTLNGPASVTLSKIDDGIIDLTNVASATVSGFYGELDINSGVETLTTTDSVRIDLDGATDLVTATLDFKNDWDPTLTTAQAAVSAALYSTDYMEDYNATGSIGGNDLKTLTVTGELLDLYLDEANLETLDINATMTALTISSATDLTTLTVNSASKIGSISLTGSNNLTVADFNHTTNLEQKGSATALKSVSFVVTDNLGLTKLHTTGDDVSTFTVTGNDALTELDMTGLKDQGTAASATVNLYDNDLTAVSASNTTDGETNKDDGASGDAGSFDDGTSGMDTMKVYLTAIAADSDNTAQVNFDTVSSEVDTETTGVSTTTLNVLGTTSVSSTTNEATVLKMTPSSVTTAAVADKQAVAQKMGWYVDQIAASGGTVRLSINGANIPASGAYTLTGNDEFDAAQIASATNVADANSAGAILAAHVGAFSTGTVQLIDHANNATTAVGERYTTDAALTTASTDTTGGGVPVWSLDHYDEFTLGVGGTNSVTVSLGSGATTIAAIETKILAAWAAKYGIAGTASASAIATLVGAADGLFNIQMLQSDSGGYDKAVTFGFENKGTAAQSSRTGGNLGWRIGATKATGDNNTISSANDGLIITVTSKVAGTDLNTLSTITTATDGVKATMVAFTTNYTANSTWSAGTGANAYTGAQAERTDVASAEDFVAGSAAVSSTAVNFSRVAWLG